MGIVVPIMKTTAFICGAHLFEEKYAIK